MQTLILSNHQVPAIKEVVIKGLEIASGAKSSATYYHTRQAQVEAVRNAISNLYGVSKELPLLLAALPGATGFFIQEALLNELKQTTRGGACHVVSPIDWYDEQLAETIISTALRHLDQEAGITYVLRLFTQLKERKINNARARHLPLHFIWNHANLEYASVKYRSKLKVIFSHAYGKKMTSILVSIAQDFMKHGVFKSEKEQGIAKSLTRYANWDNERVFRLFLFVLGETDGITYSEVEFPVISQFFRAKQDILGIRKLPEEVLLGLIANRKHPQYDALWSAEEKRKVTQAEIRKTIETTTANRQIRQTKQNVKLEITEEVKVKVEQVTNFLALYKTGYETGFTPALQAQIEALAQQKRLKDFAYSSIGIIVDESISGKGHQQESRNTPKAIIQFTAKVLEYSAQKATVVKTKGATTDLATPFLELMKMGEAFDAVFILSDGYENSYDGLLNEVIVAWQKLTGKSIPMYHLSPITSAETNAKVRSLGSQISTLAISKPESIALQLSAKLIEQDFKRWLENQFKTFLSKQAHVLQ